MKLTRARPDRQAMALRRSRAAGLWPAVLLLSACLAAPEATTTPPAIPGGPTATPTSVLANSTSVPATPDTEVQMLRLWLPPQFAPDENTAGGRTLLAQLAAFEQARGWHVDVRVKKLTGQGGLLDALHTSLKVAPGVSPDIIALDSPMLANEAGSDSLQPLPQFSEGDLVDFYGSALDAARRGDSLGALPFAVDVLGFAYSTILYPVPPQSWTDLKPENGSAALPLNDTLALLTLQQYAALGGQFVDAGGQAALDKLLLTQVLTDYQGLQASGVLPFESLTATSPEITWGIYREGRASAAVTFLGAYLAERRRVTATAFAAIPTHTGARATFARQWSYALVTTDPSRQAIALELMRWLTAPDNLGVWSLAAGVAPARSQALSAWSDPGLAAVADQLLKSAQPEPAPAILALVGPALNNAVQSVLSGQATPEQAAGAAAAAVAGG